MARPTLGELLRDSDALTFVNAIKVTQTQIKKELNEQQEMAGFLNASVERTHKLMRKADSQYRTLAKLAQGTEPTLADITVDANLDDDEYRELMEEV